MKKLSFTSIILVLTLSATSQIYITTGINSRGVSAGVGGLSGNGGVEINMSVNKPLIRADVPTLFTLSIGKQFLITQNPDDNYSITPIIGASNMIVKDFTDYDRSTMGRIKTTTGIAANYGIEIGKDAYKGRVSLTANYCKGFYFGATMRIFFSRFENN